MGKKKDLLTPTTFSLLHATDFADRLYYKIVPALKAGMIVLADRYAFTAFGRDVARGVGPQWVRNLYSFAVRPDAAFYFRVPVEVSLARILSGRAKIKYHEAGMDVGLSDDVHDSFKLFQGRIIDEYDRMVDEFDLRVIDATREIDDQQHEVREFVGEMLRRAAAARRRRCRRAMSDHGGPLTEGRARPGSTRWPEERENQNPRGLPWLGEGLPYVDPRELHGKLITIEGTDSSGRSTQMKGIREWLEVQGFGVVETGWTRSALMFGDIDLASRATSSTASRSPCVRDRLRGSPGTRSSRPSSPASSSSPTVTCTPPWPARGFAESTRTGCARSTASPSSPTSFSISRSTPTPSCAACSRRRCRLLGAGWT